MEMLHNLLHFYPEGDGTGGSGDGGQGGEGGTGSGTQDPPKPQEGSPATQDGGGEGGGTGEDSELAKVRREAAGYRTQLREVQAKLKEIEDKDKSEAQQLKEKVDELTGEIGTLTQRVRTSTVAALAADVGIVKEARSDAASLVDWSKIEDPSDTKAVEKALRELVKEKPYLTGGVAGGADGGSGGRGGASTQTMSDRIRAAAGRR